MSRFLLDEDVQLSLTGVLRDGGHDAVHVLELNLRGSLDNEVLEAAIADARILITADIGIADARSLSGTPHTGVILLRMPHELSVESWNAEVMALLPDVPLDDFSDMLAVIEPGVLRIRRTRE